MVDVVTGQHGGTVDTTDPRFQVTPDQILVRDAGQQYDAAAIKERLHQGAEQTQSTFTDASHPCAVEDQIVGFDGQPFGLANHDFGRGEHQVTLQFQHHRASAPLTERGQLGGVARAFARDLRSVIGGVYDGRHRHAAGMQGMQAVVRRNLATHRNAARTIAAIIEWWREHRQAKLAGQHRDDTATHATLGRHADLVHPRTRIVVHAARHHHTQHLGHVGTAQRAHAGDGIDAVVGKGRAYHRQITAGDQQ